MPASAASAVSFKTAAVVGTAAFVAIHTRKNHPHLGVSVHRAAGGGGCPVFVPFFDVDRGGDVGIPGPPKRLTYLIKHKLKAALGSQGSRVLVF